MNFIKLVISSLFMTLVKVMLTLCSIKHLAFKICAAVNSSLSAAYMYICQQSVFCAHVHMSAVDSSLSSVPMYIRQQ